MQFSLPGKAVQKGGLRQIALRGEDAPAVGWECLQTEIGVTT
jgi:hypothetical protein